LGDLTRIVVPNPRDEAIRDLAREGLETAPRAAEQTWRSLPVIKALMTLRTINFLSAIAIVSEIGVLAAGYH
jgi:hypothetical protein